MGVHLDRVLELFRDGYVTTPRPRVLDLGCSNISGIEPSTLIDFILARNPAHDRAKLAAWAELISFGSYKDPEIGCANGAWLGDVLVRAGCEYRAFDIFEGYRTELVDLNVVRLDERHRGRYDLVLNFGTTEHLLGQYNAFQVIHEATAVGGLIYHELPMTGYLDHGFVNYNPVLLVSLAEANGYEILKLGFSGAMLGERIADDLVARYGDRPWCDPVEDAEWSRAPLPTGSVRLIARKLADRPFRTSLETSTTVGEVSAEIDRNYGASSGAGDTPTRQQVLARLREFLLRAADPELQLWEMTVLYRDFLACGYTDGFPFSLELRMIDDQLKDYPDDANLNQRRPVAAALLRRQRPLLKFVDRLPADSPHPPLRFDGVEADFAPQGPAAERVEAILQAYRAYAEKCAVEVFPLSLEAEALVHIVRTEERDPDVLIRLGAVAAELTPAMDTAPEADRSDRNAHATVRFAG